MRVPEEGIVLLPCLFHQKSTSKSESRDGHASDDVIEALLDEALLIEHSHLAFFNGFIVGTLRPTPVLVNSSMNNRTSQKESSSSTTRHDFNISL
ncbi:unnamed protein product [Amoebophrya sp. A25]|nr:unnamed protein product [Amoebophrya sp. A25]|eukprot:GSA25T00027046001.1